MKKPVIATTSLAGCFGCHMSLLDIDERLLDIVDVITIDKSPLTDIKTFNQRCLVGLIEGGCCNEENIEVLRYFREHCDILIGVGACAINGGVPAQRNGIPVEECLAEAYLAGPGVYNPTNEIPRDPDLPPILDKVYPCYDIVDIDYHMPGCPPTADAFWKVLTDLLEGRPVALPRPKKKTE